MIILACAIPGLGASCSNLVHHEVSDLTDASIPISVPLTEDRTPTALKAAAGTNIRTQTAARFLVTFTATSVLGTCCLFVFALYTNPWGNYGKTGYQRLYNARLAKTELIGNLESAQRPKAIVLGSSNTMRYDPARIEDRFGLPAFNYGVFWGRSEDALCIVRHLVKDLEHRPKLLIYGLDTWTFDTPSRGNPVVPGVRRRLLNTPQLVRHYPGLNAFQRYWAKFVDALSIQQLELGWNCINDSELKRRTMPPLAESSLFTSDGMRIGYWSSFEKDKPVFEEVEAGKFPIDDLLQAITKSNDWSRFKIVDSMYGVHGQNAQRIAFLEDLLALCDREGIDVLFVINPVQPTYYKHLQKTSNHEENLRELRKSLHQWQLEYACVKTWFDASRVEYFGGDPDGFYDPFHPATRNCNLIIDELAKRYQAP